MQNVVLFNNFDHDKELLAGDDSMASKFGVIHYYDDSDIQKWCPGFKIIQCKGIRTFWDLQQVQDCHKDPEWQEKMIEIENMVEDISEYKNIAFFHHLFITKK